MKMDIYVQEKRVLPAHLGFLAAGDIRTKALRQIVTAVSDGANAVASAQKYLWRKDNGND